MKTINSAVCALPIICFGTSSLEASDFWAGTHIGLQIGVGSSEFNELAPLFEGSEKEDRLVGGVSIGYRWRLNSGWYIGPEFQLDLIDIEDFSIDDPNTGDSVSYDGLGRLKLVGGREVSGGNGLLFGSFGIAYSGLDTVGSSVADVDDSQTGWTVGFGYDHRIGQSNWTLGGEYIHHSFDTIDYDVVLLRVQYRF